MPQRTVLIPDIGEVLLVKRRGTKSVRLSVTAAGQVRVSMPSWTPYQTGENFARSKSDWLQQQIGKYAQQSFQPGMSIGKDHKLQFVKTSSQKITAKITPTEVKIHTGLDFQRAQVQQKARQASEKALRQESETLLVDRLQQLARQHGFSFKSARIKKLTSRWGSCSSRKEITLSYFLIQLPWHLIDYVLIHELVHTQHMNHGKDFWEAFGKALPNVRALQKEIRDYKPRLEPHL
jgi:predicted metal-dependent hydrolase